MPLFGEYGADGLKGFGCIEEGLNGFAYLVLKDLRFVGDEAGQIVALEVLPEAFDRIEIRAVGRKIERLYVVPVEPLGLVPTGIVQDEADGFAPSWPHFLCHGIEKDLEDLCVAVWNDQADQLT